MPKHAKPRRIPKLANEEREREFWARQASSHYIDWSSAESTSLPNLRPSTKPSPSAFPNR